MVTPQIDLCYYIRGKIPGRPVKWEAARAVVNPSVLLGQAGTCVQAMLTVYNYPSFVTLMLAVFGASFGLPGQRAEPPARPAPLGAPTALAAR